MPIHTDFIRAFLTRWETRQTVAYLPCRRRNYTGARPYDETVYGPVIGASGVTVGTGLDLGQQAEADLRRMGVSDALIARFRPYLGKRTAEAVAVLAAAPLTLSDAECDALDTAVHADYIARAAILFDRYTDLPFADCPAEAQAVIVSLFYHLASPFATYGHLGYPVLYSRLCHGDWPAASRELLPGFTRYANRRADEGRLIGSLAAKEAV